MDFLDLDECLTVDNNLSYFGYLMPADYVCSQFLLVKSDFDL